MINILIDTDQHEFWVEQGLDDSVEYCISQDLQSWVSDPNQTKIALVEILQHEDIIDKKIHQICFLADRAILFIPELIDQNWLTEFDLPNVSIYVAGKLNGVSLSEDQIT
jgi:hypothetical protein